MSNNIDINLITENFTEILTNTINIASVFYDMFFKETPDVLNLEQYVYNGTEIELKTVQVPNLASIKKDLEESVATREATETTFGVVKIDNSTIKKNQNSQIHVPIDNDTIKILENGNIGVDKSTFIPDKATVSFFVTNVNDNSNVNFWVGSQDEYDSVSVKDPNTLYFIQEEASSDSSSSSGNTNTTAGDEPTMPGGTPVYDGND